MNKSFCPARKSSDAGGKRGESGERGKRGTLRCMHHHRKVIQKGGEEEQGGNVGSQKLRWWGGVGRVGCYDGGIKSGTKFDCIKFTFCNMHVH